MGFIEASNAYANNANAFISFQYIFGGSKQYVKFKAFMTEYKDDYAVSWNSEQVYGRNDPIMTYQNTVRTLQVSWEVPSTHVGEAGMNMKRAAQLMRFCYPSYENAGNANTISKPPLLRMKFKNFARKSTSTGLLVAMQGFSFTPVIEDGFWNDSDHSTAYRNAIQDSLMPKTLTFSCTMTVLHERAVGWTISKNGSVSTWAGPGSFPFLPEGITTEGLNDQRGRRYDPGEQVAANLRHANSIKESLSNQKHEDFLFKEHVQITGHERWQNSLQAKAWDALDARSPREVRRDQRRKEKEDAQAKVDNASTLDPCGGIHAGHSHFGACD